MEQWSAGSKIHSFARNDIKDLSVFYFLNLKSLIGVRYSILDNFKMLNFQLAMNFDIGYWNSFPTSAI